MKVLIENGAMVNYRDKVCLDSILAVAIHTVTLLVCLNRLDGHVFSMQLMRDMKKLCSIYFTPMQTLKCRTR